MKSIKKAVIITKNTQALAILRSLEADERINYFSLCTATTARDTVEIKPDTFNDYNTILDEMNQIVDLVIDSKSFGTDFVAAEKAAKVAFNV